MCKNVTALHVAVLQEAKEILKVLLNHPTIAPSIETRTKSEVRKWHRQVICGFLKYLFITKLTHKCILPQTPIDFAFARGLNEYVNIFQKPSAKEHGSTIATGFKKIKRESLRLRQSPILTEKKLQRRNTNT